MSKEQIKISEDAAYTAAYIVKRINDIVGKAPGKKVLQKMVFLIEQKGVNLGYDYGIHFYGPYSSKLDTDTYFLSADGIINFSYTRLTHEMTVGEGFEILPDCLSDEQKKGIDEVIERFREKKGPELELLTTAIYAYNHLDDKSRESVIAGVVKLKGEKYRRDEIERALEEFAYFEKDFAA